LINIRIAGVACTKSSGRLWLLFGVDISEWKEKFKQKMTAGQIAEAQRYILKHAYASQKHATLKWLKCCKKSSFCWKL